MALVVGLRFTGVCSVWLGLGIEVRRRGKGRRRKRKDAVREVGKKEARDGLNLICLWE